jgi:hypothetical protein
MTRLLASISLVALMALSGVAARAQDTPTPAAQTDAVEFIIGDNVYPLDPTAVINLCVMESNETPEDQRLLVQVFIRTPESNQFEPLGVAPTRGDETLRAADIGECVPQESRP